VPKAGSLRSALISIQIPTNQVDQALLALSEQLDLEGQPPAGRYEAKIAGTGPDKVLLTEVSFRDGRGSIVAVRGSTGDFDLVGPAPPRASQLAAPLGRRSIVMRGPIEQLLYGLGAAPIPAPIRSGVLGLFAHRLDFTRDVALGDRVTLVIDPAAGRLADETSGGVLYAAIDHDGHSTRFYACQTGIRGVIDGEGRPLNDELLRTPIGNPRITSVYGPRLHPLLGYSRMHRGVDFGAPAGTAVLAAGDGNVAALDWASGYGHLIRLVHQGGLETRYAHLSAWAPGLRPGAHVRQGQVIGFVGESGLATGPHLHFELYENGVARDPEHIPLTAGARPQAARLEEEQRCVTAILASGRPVSASRSMIGGPVSDNEP